MNLQAQKPPGEAAIDQATMQSVAPDVASSQGKGKLFEKAVNAHQAKTQLDAILGAVADHIGATVNSRVKDQDTAAKKIAQKRMQGRDYDIEDVNDMLGARLTMPSEKNFPKAKSAMEKLAGAGVFKINKQQQVEDGTYKAYHFDVTLFNGTKAEIQLHTTKSEAEAVTNHSLRATAGENPGGVEEKLRNKQASIIKSMPNAQANAVSQTVQQLMKQNKNQPIDPRITAQILQQAQGAR